MVSMMVSKYKDRSTVTLVSMHNPGSLFRLFKGASKSERRLPLTKRVKAVNKRDIDLLRGTSSLFKDIIKRQKKEDLAEFDPKSQLSIIGLPLLS